MGKDAVESTRAIRHEKCELTRPPGVDLGIAGSEIAEDLRASYKKARMLPVDVFLSSHTNFYNMPEKYEKLQKRRQGDPNPFVDPEGYKAHVDEFEKIFEYTLARQRAEAEGKGK